MICAGKTSEIRANSGEWIYLDIGFSRDLRTCGLAFNNDEPECVLFSVAKQKITDFIRDAGRKVCNLLIEAPLSVAFDRHGNPVGRSIEKNGRKTRYWYAGAGCTVMVASLHLLRHLVDSLDDPNIRLFEGFVSYKKCEGRRKSDHAGDVRLLREVICHPKTFPKSIYDEKRLKSCPDCRLENAFKVARISSGVPPVIVRDAPQ